ncbi:MAG: ankyrin repeat domain-containing protein [Aliarcobacter sp.]|jgi:ankyrin repeat protein|nr:ankyrin repeat domain-containing protein [Aliarcobacter sp.]
MKKIYFISFIFMFLFTSCVQKQSVNTKLSNPIIKNDTLSNISLHDAVRAKNFNEVKEIVSDGFLLNTQDKFDFTALHLAVRFNQYDIVKFLIKKRVSINTVDIYGDTPLLESVRNRTNDISELLLCNGAKKDVKDKNLLTPLDYASLYNDLSMIKMLEASELIEFCDKKELLDIQEVKIDDSKSKKVKRIKSVDALSLYEALKIEFYSDLIRWDAEIKKDNLIFRFKNTDMLFSHGSSELSAKYKSILNEFFPRYLKVLYTYKEQIDLVKIEGHTSSVYSSAKNENEKYTKNKELSTKRANEVFNYISLIDNKLIKEHSSWLNDFVKPYGMGYDNLIYTEGKENESLSRRVDFIIIKKK